MFYSLMGRAGLGPPNSTVQYTVYVQFERHIFATTPCLIHTLYILYILWENDFKNNKLYVSKVVLQNALIIFLLILHCILFELSQQFAYSIQVCNFHNACSANIKFTQNYLHSKQFYIKYMRQYCVKELSLFVTNKKKDSFVS